MCLAPEQVFKWPVNDESESSTRNQIVNATPKLIEDRGIAHITTKQIPQAAGCGEGTIFRHFARKEDLLSAPVIANMPALRESLMFITEEIRVNVPIVSA